LKAFRPNGESSEALRINHGRLEHHSTGFFSVDGQSVRVREMESLAIAEMHGLKRAAYLGAAPDQVEKILNSDTFRRSLVRDVNMRSAAKLRALN
jgi:hypothetical protein